MKKYKSIFNLILYTLILFTGCIAASEPELIVTTSYGKIRGIDNGGILSFRGIPYAKAPINDLRWRAPSSPNPWTDVLDASKYSSQCAQNNELGVFSHPGGTEDCLYLNVFVNKAAHDTETKLPVFFWIHGGGLMVGAGSDYDPSRLVNMGKGIVVTFNYRLGTLGFLSHPELDSEKTESINYGFMDQSFALDWVYKNIAAFGGDPDNITIAGESSGAHSVFAHMISPYSAGKFQFAIAMSGGNVVNRYPNFASPLPREEATKLGLNFAHALGVKSAQELRNLPLYKILQTQSQFVVRTPIIDGDFLPTSYEDAFINGHVHHVTLINGNTMDEGTFFSGTYEQLSGKMLCDEDYVNLIKEGFGAMAEKVLLQYPLSNYANAAEAYAAVFTDAVFAAPGMKINDLLWDKIPVYAYEFADRTAPSYLSPVSLATNAYHTSEIPYLFPEFNGSSNKSTALNSPQEQLAEEMANIWTNIKNINQVAPTWSRYNPSMQNIMTFRLPNSTIIQGKFKQQHNSHFWNEYSLH